MPTIFNSINEVIQFAIREEEAAYNFYMSMVEMCRGERLRLTFKDFADEEKKHRQKLVDVLNDKDSFAEPETQREIKVSEYAVSGEYTRPDGRGSEIQKMYVMAMAREKASFKLYTDLAEMADGQECKQLLRSLAQEEARHKLKLEIEYEEQFMQDN